MAKEALPTNSFTKEDSNPMTKPTGEFGIGRFGTARFGTQTGHATPDKEPLPASSDTKEALDNKIT